MDFSRREVQLIVNALAYSIAVFERLPLDEQPANDVIDMKRMLETLVHDGSEFELVLNTARTRIEAGLRPRQ